VNFFNCVMTVNGRICMTYIDLTLETFWADGYSIEKNTKHSII
jgi:hypothetical protein